MRLLCRISIGASSMLSVIAARNGCVTSASIRRFCSSSASSANPNSPPCDSTMPVRSALNHWPA